MFLFSKKGGVLVLITLGVLLSLGGPTHAIKCYECFFLECADPAKVVEKDCEGQVQLCVRRRLIGPSKQWTQKAECGEDYDGTSLGCNATKGYSEGHLTCLCDTDLCNTKDLISSDGVDGGVGPDPTGEGGTKPGVPTPVLSASRFGILALSLLVLVGPIRILST